MFSYQKHYIKLRDWDAYNAIPGKELLKGCAPCSEEAFRRKLKGDDFTKAITDPHLLVEVSFSPYPGCCGLRIIHSSYGAGYVVDKPRLPVPPYALEFHSSIEDFIYYMKLADNLYVDANKTIIFADVKGGTLYHTAKWLNLILNDKYSFQRLSCTTNNSGRNVITWAMVPKTLVGNDPLGLPVAGAYES